MRGVLADNRARDARREYVSKDDHFGAILLAGQGIAAAQSCSTALNEFREIVRTETSMGHVTTSRRRIRRVARAELAAQVAERAVRLAAANARSSLLQRSAGAMQAAGSAFVA